jgi:dihydrolipoamide dehydrogenase
LTYDLKDGRVLGAVAVGPGAADVLAPVVVALRLNGRVSDLAGLYGAYPSLGELPFIAARAAG